MALEFTVDSTEGMDENIAALYAKGDDGKFTLDMTGGPKVEDTTALKNALETERDRNKFARQWEAIGKSPDEITELLKAQEKTEEEAAKKRGDFDAIRKQDQDKWEAERKTLREENAAMGVIERKAVIENNLTFALAEAGFTKEGLALLPNTLSPRIKIEVVDGVRETRIYQADGETLMAGDGKGGAATFANLAEEVAKLYPSLVRGSGTGGGGKLPSSKGGKPDGRKFNEYTGAELAAIRKTNPDEYNRLKSERDT